MSDSRKCYYTLPKQNQRAPVLNKTQKRSQTTQYEYVRYSLLQICAPEYAIFMNIFYNVPGGIGSMGAAKVYLGKR